MTDLSENNEYPPIMPSIPDTEGARVSRAIQNSGYLSTQNDALQGALYQQTRRLEELGVADAWDLDAVRTELGPRVKMDRVGNKYKIAPRPNTIGS